MLELIFLSFLLIFLTTKHIKNIFEIIINNPIKNAPFRAYINNRFSKEHDYAASFQLKEPSKTLNTIEKEYNVLIPIIVALKDFMLFFILDTKIISNNANEYAAIPLE